MLRHPLSHLLRLLDQIPNHALLQWGYALCVMRSDGDAEPCAVLFVAFTCRCDWRSRSD